MKIRKDKLYIYVPKIYEKYFCNNFNMISAIFRQNGGDDFATENFKESAFLAESSNSSI